jgi:tRNA dimethylallyltransferase
MIDYKKPIIVLAGPTATGKSSKAIKIAQEIDGVIINADSRQIYKELKIGTAQPEPDKVQNGCWYIDGIKHYLYGHVSITEKYNLYQYQKDVQRILDKEEKTPILVGGTGLYIDSVVYNYDLSPNKKSNTDYSREKLSHMSVKELQSIIKKDTLQKLNHSDLNNPTRLIRIIERGGINRKKGKPLNHIYIIIDTDIENLKENIRNRVEEMFETGLIEENQHLIESGYNSNLSSMRSIGYQEFEGYFDNKKSIQQVKEEIILHTVQYAKRQKTWFKRNNDTVKVKNYKQIYDSVLNFLSTV